MFGFRKAIIAWSNRGALKHSQAFCEFLEMASDDEAAMTLVNTALAAKFLRITSSMPAAFPEALLHGVEIAQTPEEIAAVSSYILALERLRRDFRSHPTHQHTLTLIGAGCVVMMHSLRAVGRGRPEFLVLGRKMWREILRGLPQFPETYREFCKPDATDIEIREALFIPLMLVPSAVGQFVPKGRDN